MTTAAVPSSIAPTPVELDPQLAGRLQRLAEARQRTPQGLMRDAIEQYVQREEQRQSLREDTLKAWEDYQATGLHVTGEEVEAWLASWGTDNELPMPECHK